METKITFAKGWIKFWSFIASLFQDKAEDTSTKRVIVLGAFVMFCRVIEKNMQGFKIDDNILITLVIIIIGGIGLTIPEWFSPKSKTASVPGPPIVQNQV